MFLTNPITLSVIGIIASFLVIRVLSKLSLMYVVRQWWRLFQDKFHASQFYRVPQFNEHMQENQLYRKVFTYLNSLPCVEDSEFANLFSGNKSCDISLVIDSNQIIVDTFLSARIYWTNEKTEKNVKTLVLKIRRKDKRRILRPYLQHIHSVFEEIEQRRKEVKLYINTENEPSKNGRWLSVPFTHPATIETVVMESSVRTFRHRKINLYSWNGEIPLLRHLTEKSNSNSISMSAILNFMDGILSCCGEERVMVFTMNVKDQIDPTVLRPGRIDVHINFPLCDFSAFKALASSHLGLKEHKLFPQVEEIFQTGANLSPAEISELMISNRLSPTRALKSVITALQSNGDSVTTTISKIPRRLTGSGSGRTAEDSGESGVLSSGQEEGVQSVSEFRKLYGMFKLRGSRREQSTDLDSFS